MLIILLDHNAQHLPLSLSLRLDRLNDGWLDGWMAGRMDGDVIVTNLPHIWVLGRLSEVIIPASVHHVAESGNEFGQVGL